MERNRREFIRSAALTGLGIWVYDKSWANVKSPNERPQFACIGIDGKGRSDTADAARYGDIVAICDVDETRLNKAGELYPKAKKYKDYRKMLEEMDKSIDAVTVSTPDHVHGVAAGMAMQMGKHAYCQKPLTRTLWEARRLSEIAKSKKVMTQMGNQGTAANGLRKSAAMIRAGVLGTVTEVHCWTNRPIWPQGHDRPAKKDVPANLDWDLWLGPAKAREFGDGYHPFAWRGFWDFGSGALGDMACHTMNMPFMALDLRNPISVEAVSSGHNKDTYSKWAQITYQFAATDKRGPIKLVWYEGGKKIADDLLPGEKLADSASLVVGSKGKLYTPGDYGDKGKLIGVEATEVTYPESPGHFEELIRAIKTGEQPMSNIVGYSGPLTETVLLGNLAVWGGDKIEWDAANLKATNGAKVGDLIKPKFRSGYKL